MNDNAISYNIVIVDDHLIITIYYSSNFDTIQYPISLSIEHMYTIITIINHKID